MRMRLCGPTVYFYMLGRHTDKRSHVASAVTSVEVTSLKRTMVRVLGRRESVPETKLYECRVRLLKVSEVGLRRRSKGLSAYSGLVTHTEVLVNCTLSSFTTTFLLE
jgi:hypothetical protein